LLAVEADSGAEAGAEEEVVVEAVEEEVDDPIDSLGTTGVVDIGSEGGTLAAMVSPPSVGSELIVAAIVSSVSSDSIVSSDSKSISESIEESSLSAEDLSAEESIG
jgi:hypothetical protein